MTRKGEKDRGEVRKEGVGEGRGEARGEGRGEGHIAVPRSQVSIEW